MCLLVRESYYLVWDYRFLVRNFDCNLQMIKPQIVNVFILAFFPESSFPRELMIIGSDRLRGASDQVRLCSTDCCGGEYSG